uniref:Uncharacterized protein n=1 Tax=Acrobeloides nanus TaxID=290746 RepID=A0A914DTU1_9BILA
MDTTATWLSMIETYYNDSIQPYTVSNDVKEMYYIDAIDAIPKLCAGKYNISYNTVEWAKMGKNALPTQCYYHTLKEYFEQNPNAVSEFSILIDALTKRDIICLLIFAIFGIIVSCLNIGIVLSSKKSKNPLGVLVLFMSTANLILYLEGIFIDYADLFSNA